MWIYVTGYSTQIISITTWDKVDKQDACQMIIPGSSSQSHMYNSNHVSNRTNVEHGRNRLIIGH